MLEIAKVEENTRMVAEKERSDWRKKLEDGASYTKMSELNKSKVSEKVLEIAKVEKNIRKVTEKKRSEWRKTLKEGVSYTKMWKLIKRKDCY